MTCGRLKLVLISSAATIVVGCSSGGGTAGTGGSSASGGAVSNGGTTGAGGALSSGGAPGSGGSPATGGAPGTGGTMSSGGATASGGSLATGGATGNGGATSTGGRGGSSGSSGSSGTGGRGGVSGTGGNAAGGSTACNISENVNFFVTSDTSATGNLGGLAGADMRCQRLAGRCAQTSGKTWRAYLSAANPATNARDRIGPGPYFNVMGTMIAADKNALHARGGDAALFLTELGGKVNGQWTGSPAGVEHDILTGTQRDGTLATGLTCGDWMAITGSSEVGHSDGFGPSQAITGSYTYWNAAHTGQCGNTTPGGGAGRLYCFVGP